MRLTIRLGNAAAKWIATEVTKANFKYKTRTKVTTENEKEKRTK